MGVSDRVVVVVVHVVVIVLGPCAMFLGAPVSCEVIGIPPTEPNSINGMTFTVLKVLRLVSNSCNDRESSAFFLRCHGQRECVL